MKTIVILPSDGRVLIAPIKNEITLDMLQTLVEGNIEIVPARADGCVMVINDEGKLRNLTYNRRATGMMAYLGDYIVGLAVLCKRDGEDLVPFRSEREAKRVVCEWMHDQRQRWCEA